MDRKERWELIWLLFVLVVFGIVLGVTAPLDFIVGGVPSTQSLLYGVPASKIIQVNITSMQYVFVVTEQGSGINSSMLGLPYYYNLIVAHPGDYLNLTMHSKDVTSNFYFPDYSGRVIDDQILPGIPTYDVLPVPKIPGAYTFLSSEYTGPWFSYQIGLLLVLPTSGYFSPNDISEYQAQTNLAKTTSLKGNPYNPPIMGPATTFTLIGDQYGTLNASIPGPTLITMANQTVTIKIYIPTPNSNHNYLYNYSASGKPYPVTNVEVGIYAVWWNGTITPVIVKPIQYDTYMTFTFTATAPAYLYGIITPVFYNYNPANLSGSIGSLIGVQKGYVMGAWGVILVEG